MKPFMDKDFMLSNDTAKKLYHDYAADMPIFDYHCHLSPQMMYEDKPFKNITEIFLGGDHYKWRYMRSNGIDEEYITGGASDYDKFKAFCSCLQYAVGNPLYHWTHLELKRYFGVEEIVTEKTCGAIWEKCNAVISDTKMSPSTLINSSNVAVICTTDDPADSLEWHKKIAEKGHIKAKVYPTYRPDFLINIDKDTFMPYVERLSKTCGKEIKTYDDLISAACERADFFHAAGCRISDHALDGVPYSTSHSPSGVFDKAMRGETVTKDEAAAYKTGTLTALGKKYKELGWAMQLHIGALRNNNSRMFKKLGADTGFDSIADYEIAAALSANSCCESERESNHSASRCNFGTMFVLTKSARRCISGRSAEPICAATFANCVLILLSTLSNSERAATCSLVSAPRSSNSSRYALIASVPAYIIGNKLFASLSPKMSFARATICVLSSIEASASTIA